MSRGKKVAIVVGVLLVLLGGLGLALPTIAARGLESKLTSSLKDRAQDATWSSLEVDWSGSLDVRDVKVEDPERGVEFVAERVFIKPTLKSLLDGEPHIKEVRLVGASLKVDAGKIKAKMDASGEKKDSEKDAVKKKPSSTLEKLKHTLRNDPPSVSFERVEVEVAWNAKPIFTFSTREGTLEREGEEVALSARGDAAIVWEKIPRLMRQARPWGVDARVGLHEKTARVSLTSGNKAAALLDLVLPRVGYLKMGALDLDVSLTDEARHARVDVRDLDTKLGDVDELIASIKAKHLSTDLLAERHHVNASGVALEVTPQKLTEIQNLGKRLKPSAILKKRVSRASEPVSWRSALARVEQYALKANAMLMKGDAHIEDATLAVHLLREGEKSRRIELVRELTASLEDGVVLASGKSSGGEFSAMAVMSPGQALPTSASLHASHVDIAKLPGMEKGRTLPNRGVRGRVSGIVDLSMQWSGPTLDRREATMLAGMRWTDGSLYLHGLAPGELDGLSLQTSALMRWRPDEGMFSVEDGKVIYNGLEADFEGSMRDWPLEPLLRFEAQMPETECQDMIDAMPDEMLGPYRKVTLSGKAAPSLDVKYPLNRPHHLEVILDGLAEEDNPVFRRKRRRSGEEDPLSPIHKNFYCKVTGLKADRSGWPDVDLVATPGSVGQATAKTKPPGWRNPRSLGDVYWLNKPFVKQVPEEGVYDDEEVFVGPGLETYVPLSRMPIWVPGAAYLSEEILFYSNRGVSMGLIQKALRINLERGRFVYGGSTVTQQLVKNLFLSRDKTLARKLQEALISLRIDEVVSKNRVIELYLNCIEFGPNLYGIGPAAEFYFQKKPSELTPMEAVFLAIIKPSPSYGAHLKRRGKLPDSGWINKRVETIFKRMVEYEVLTQEEADAARPYTLEWDKQGNYIPREKKASEKLDELLKFELFDP